MKHLFLVLACLAICFMAHGQEVLENNPPSVKWQKIKTPHFNILYPKGFEDQAQRVAGTFEHIRDAESKSLGIKPRKISIILQNQSSESNGFVSLIPKRSEFYTMPPQDYNFGGTNDWLNQLVTHEYRHMVQFEKANTGFNKALYYLFGPATLSAMSMVAAPQWFWEGDAVATETAFTHSGRGRIPNFGLVFRTNFLEGRTFNYHKQYLRSYKHNIPDHYVLGYHMISYLRKRTGDPDIWGKISKRAFNVSFVPFTFSNAIKKESGLYVTQLYREMAADLKKTWEEEVNKLSLTPYQQVTKRNSKTYTDFRYPHVLPDGSILALKSGIGDIPQFVRLQRGEEQRVFTPGMINDAGMLSVSGETIVWTEYGFDPRWRVKTYSLIKTYNVATHQYKTITRKTRYAGASLSPDAAKIATTESNTEYQNSLLIIDSGNGQVLKKFSNPTNAFYSMARWSNDGRKIVSLKTEKGDRSVVSIDVDSGTEQVLISATKENIGHPVLFENYLFYNSPLSGIDNIYVLEISSQQRLQVTTSKYGAYNPSVSPDGKTIYYNEQSRDGLDVVTIPFDPGLWKPLEVKQETTELFHVLEEQEGRPTLFDSIPQQQFETKRYSKLSGVFNPYSWGAYFNSTFTQADIGISSQDILSTTALKAGYLFDIYERTGAWRVGVSYQGWYPIIDVNFLFANRSVNEGNYIFHNVTTATNDTTDVIKNLTFDWKEKTVEVGLRLPLITTNSKYHGSLSFSNYVGYTQVTDFKNSINSSRFIPNYIVDGEPSVNSGYLFFDYVGQGSLIYNHFGLSAYRLLKQSRRDIYSKWGQVVNIDFFDTPFGGDYRGELFSFYSTLYFPGLFKHHSLWGYWAYQKTTVDVSLNDYIFRNNIPTPRGQSVYRFEKFYSMSVNYTMPLWYPDIALGPILNIQRFWGNAFLDYGYGDKVLYYDIANQSYISVGAELRTDINIFRFLPQFNLGIRYTYGINPSLTELEFLLGVVNF